VGADGQWQLANVGAAAPPAYGKTAEGPIKLRQCNSWLGDATLARNRGDTTRCEQARTGRQSRADTEDDARNHPAEHAVSHKRTNITVIVSCHPGGRYAVFAESIPAHRSAVSQLTWRRYSESRLKRPHIRPMARIFGRLLSNIHGCLPLPRGSIRLAKGVLGSGAWKE
jgi:hypothetical protein